MSPINHQIAENEAEEGGGGVAMFFLSTVTNEK